MRTIVPQPFCEPTLRYLAFYKPFEVLSQFTDQRGRRTLKEYIPVEAVYPAGRLDYRSEGLLILSDDGLFIQRLTDPDYNHPKIYLAEVEYIASPENVSRLETEILLPDIQTRTARAEIIQPPDLPPRPVPVRPYHPTSWIRITLYEGKKHQVRRLTAAIGHPTLRLVRIAIGSIDLGTLEPGRWRDFTHKELVRVLRETSLSNSRVK
jgi:23S rRNA pseudouridine2457 synthase